MVRGGPSQETCTGCVTLLFHLHLPLYADAGNLPEFARADVSPCGKNGEVKCRVMASLLYCRERDDGYLERRDLRGGSRSPAALEDSGRARAAFRRSRRALLRSGESASGRRVAPLMDTYYLCRSRYVGSPYWYPSFVKALAGLLQSYCVEFGVVHWAHVCITKS